MHDTKERQPAVLLIYPPFAEPRAPALGIPALAAHLKKKGIRVAALDANVEFFRRFLAGEKIAGGKEFAEERMQKLNEKKRLNFTEKLELYNLALALPDPQKAPVDPGRLFTPEAGREPDAALRAFFASLPLAAAPHAPEFLMAITRFRFLRYLSPFRKFSSRDILLSLESPSLLDGILTSLLKPALQESRPRVVGISLCYPDQVLAAFRCARIVRKIDPGVHITAGGSFVSCHMREVRERALFDVIDSLILDAGEKPLERLVEELGRGSPDPGKVPALIYRDRGRIRRNALPPPPDLNAQPAPDYLVFPLDRYLLGKDGLWLSLPLSRGCSWARCAFCATRLNMIRCHQQPQADPLYRRLGAISEQTGVKNFFFVDDAASPQVLESLSRRFLKDRLGLKWIAGFRFDPDLTLQRCLLFRRAGCQRVNLGLEVYNDRLLRLLRKGISTGLSDKVFSNMYWAGLDAFVYLMVGLPTETEEEARASLERIRTFQRRGMVREYVYGQFHINPYSDIARHPRKYGIESINAPVDLDLFPPIFNFRGRGMPRATAARMQARLTSAGRRIPRELAIAKRRVRLRHDLLRFRGVLETMDSIALGEQLRRER